MSAADNRAELLALAERVEAATGSDRELDRDIMLAAVPCDRAPFRYWMPMNENTGHGAVDIERVYYGPHCAQAVAVPAYTASIDAAMMLVPEGWFTRLATEDRHSHSWRWELRGGFGLNVGSRAATPALALTAAALRARAAELGEAQ
ncbi:hypothetical protein [Sphingomonas soli]|uniref:hypothetical protein n=1 Tax=Sphingomonas soli TaxID=266127 RepID=UPI000830DF7E|nr:hypothetical protein [Sphingomonas soli]